MHLMKANVNFFKCLNLKLSQTPIAEFSVDTHHLFINIIACNKIDTQKQSNHAVNIKHSPYKNVYFTDQSKEL